MSPGLLTMDGSGDLARATARQIAADVKKEESRIGRAHVRAAQDVQKKFVEELRADVRDSGFRNAGRLANTWRGRTFPSSGGSLSPAIWIFNRSPQIVDAFSLGVPIRARSGRFLAVPVGQAVEVLRSLNLARNRSRDGVGRFRSEGKAIDRVAERLGADLGFRPPMGGKPGLLFARAGRGRTEEVLFVLVKSVNPPVRMKGRAMLPALSARVAQEFAAALERYV